MRRIIKIKTKKKEKISATASSSNTNTAAINIAATNTTAHLSNPNLKKLKSKGIIERLYQDRAKGVATLALWLPLFTACWIVSGIFLNNLLLLTLSVLPLLFFHLYFYLNESNEIPFNRELKIILIGFGILSPLLIYFHFNNALLSIICLLSNAIYFLIKNIETDSIKKVFLKSFLLFLILGLFAQIGILSQTSQSNNLNEFKFNLIYSVLGLIPGSLLAAREMLIHFELFKKNGWKLSTEALNKKGEKVYRPASFTRLIVITMILGPAFPALQLPFTLLPDAFLISSLAFIYIPKIAQKIQDSENNHYEQIINLAQLSLALGFLCLIAGLVS